MREVLAPFGKRDRWNFDETRLFAFAPPDRGLATTQMSGKKKSKFCITIEFACNVDGSERMLPFFIGKSKQPCCFKKRLPAEHGFYYRNNKKAWMTAELFEEWVWQVYSWDISH
jgi:DDE superfamily endonuclease